MTTDLIENINRGLDRIKNYIKGVGTSLQNPFNILDGIRGSLNTIGLLYKILQLNVINIRTYYMIQFNE